jgi:hypothetical protein
MNTSSCILYDDYDNIIGFFCSSCTKHNRYSTICDCGRHICYTFKGANSIVCSNILPNKIAYCHKCKERYSDILCKICNDDLKIYDGFCPPCYNKYIK